MVRVSKEVLRPDRPTPTTTPSTVPVDSDHGEEDPKSPHPGPDHGGVLPGCGSVSVTSGVISPPLRRPEPGVTSDGHRVHGTHEPGVLSWRNRWCRWRDGVEGSDRSGGRSQRRTTSRPGGGGKNVFSFVLCRDTEKSRGSKETEAVRPPRTTTRVTPLYTPGVSEEGRTGPETPSPWTSGEKR